MVGDDLLMSSTSLVKEGGRFGGINEDEDDDDEDDSPFKKITQKWINLNLTIIYLFMDFNNKINY